MSDVLLRATFSGQHLDGLAATIGSTRLDVILSETAAILETMPDELALEVASCDKFTITITTE